MSRPPQARHADPDFVPSLRLLVEREQYSLTDIAMMFDVSRERARQWAWRYGLAQHKYPRGMNAERVWDDASNRFVVKARGEIVSAARRAQSDRARAKRIEKHAARRAAVIAHVTPLMDQLGRLPTAEEMFYAVLPHIDAEGRPKKAARAHSAYLAIWFEGRSTADTMKRLRAACGLPEVYPRGNPLKVQGALRRAYVEAVERRKHAA